MSAAPSPTASPGRTDAHGYPRALEVARARRGAGRTIATDDAR